MSQLTDRLCPIAKLSTCCSISLESNFASKCDLPMCKCDLLVYALGSLSVCIFTISEEANQKKEE